MATVGRRRYGERVQGLAGEANPAFAAAAVVVPLAVLAIAVAIGNARLLFYTHVATGATWFAFAIIMPAVLGPTIGSLTPAAAKEFSATFVPKATFFVNGVSATAVLSGTLLASQWGLLGSGNAWVQAALGLGWGLWVFGLVVVNRLHLKMYYEGQSVEPDAERLERLERLAVGVGLFDAVLMLVVIYVMTNLRF